MEIEAKYRAENPSALEHLRQAEQLGPYLLFLAGDFHVTDHFLDTDDRALNRNGYVCRLREKNEKRIVTIKRAGKVEGAVHEREEYETEIEPDSLPKDWPDGQVKEIVLSTVGDRPLTELFSNKQYRIVRSIHRGDQEVGELSLDVVQIGAGDVVETSYEVEVELKDVGTKEDLAALESYLSDYDLQPQHETKFQRGLALWEARKKADSEPKGLTVEQLCARYEVDMAHARHVATMSLRLFDALPEVHGLAPERRPLLETAAILHNVGISVNPERHHLTGRDILLSGPIQGISDEERNILACTTRFHRKRVLPEKEPVFAAMSPELRRETLALSALLRVGDALDYSTSQTSRLSLQQKPDSVLMLVEGPHADSEATRAERKADLWNAVFPLPVRAVAVVEESGASESGEADSPGTEGTNFESEEREAYTLIDSDKEGKGREESSAVSEDVRSSENAPSKPAKEAKESKKGPGVLPTDSMAEAGRKVLAFHFQRLLENEKGTVEGTDPEALHDMRVASRRLRAALWLFGPFLPKKEVRQLEIELKATGGALGPVRDLDVLLAKAEKYREELPEEEQPSFDPLLTAWQSDRNKARKKMIAYLDGKEYVRFQKDFQTFLKHSPKSETKEHVVGQGKHREPERREVRHVVPGLLWDHYDEVRAYETILDGAPVTTYHALRIHCKRFRYAIEFLRETLGDSGETLIKEVTSAQDHLGDLQDASVAIELIEQFLKGWRKVIRQVGGFLEEPEGVKDYLDAQHRKQTEKQETFAPLWEEMRGERFRKLLGETTATL